MTPELYCREIEAYLTRKNDGHLIRIVGPSFTRVCGWAEQGVPLKIAFAGIDRYFERYYAKGPRRRPVHVDYCEADVLELFDAWRRAVGVTASGPDRDAPPSRSRESLATRLERAIARLTALRSGDRPPIPSELLSEVVRELDQMRASARRARGGERQTILARVATLDQSLLDAARATLSVDASTALRAQAEHDLDPFRERMPREAWTRAVEASVDRLVREHTGLPTLPVE